MWPGIVGKGPGSEEPVIPLQQMLDLTTNTQVDGKCFDGIDLNVMAPHLDIDAPTKQIREFADFVAQQGLAIGSIGAPIWPDAGGGTAMGDKQDQGHFLEAVRKACEYAAILNKHGVRKYGIIRIDSASSPKEWAKNPRQNTKRIADTFRKVADIAADYGERLAAEGEICWAGMHSWKHMLNLLEEVDRPEALGFQADLAHTYLYLLGYNEPEHALLPQNYTEEQFWEAYQILTDALGPWTIDFHVAQSDGTVFGSGYHDKTGRHCPADAEDSKLDVVKCPRYWLLDKNNHRRNGIEHICWDGCMFPNEKLLADETWRNVLRLLVAVQEDIEENIQKI